MKTPGLLLLGLTLIVSIHHAAAQGTAFTYQGRLNSGGAPANGIYDLQFTVYDSVSNGFAVSNPLTNSATGVTNGLFIVTLDFGDGIFDGNPRWLEIAVSTNGANNFVTLAPRQQITPTPYAIMANSASNLLGNLSTAQLTGTFPANQLSGTIPSSNLSGTYSGPVTFNNGSDTFDGTFIGSFFGSTFTGGSFNGQFFGDGSGLFGLWRTAGNSGTTTNSNFLGTTDNQPLEVRVNNTRILRLEPDPRGYNAGNIIGGFPGNAVEQPGSGSDFIGSGGYPGIPNTIHSNSSGVFIGSGSLNQIGPNVNDAVIVGGYGNTVQAWDSAIGGGGGNSIQTGADHATIAGGFNNSIQTNAWDSTVSGGYGNAIQPYAEFSVIGGGNINLVGTGGAFSVIGGGNFNTNASAYSFIGGGYTNLIQFNNWGAFIGAGALNTIQTGSGYSAIPSGYQNNIYSNASFSVIGGGSDNVIQYNSPGSAIGGGIGNNIYPFNYYSSIFGGQNNTIRTNANFSFIGGGAGNVIRDYASISVIGGGYNNTVITGQPFNFIGGGVSNSVGAWGYNVVGGGGWNQAYGLGAAVPGGMNNIANGNGSFAAGMYAVATNNGAFVLADYEQTNFSSTISNQFSARFTGGVRFETAGAGMTLDGQPILSGINGGSLTNVNATTLNGFSSSSFATASGSANYIQNQNAVAQAASFNISGNGTVGGTAQVVGLLRSGSETGTAQTPNPAGLVVRRINSTVATSNSVVAVARNSINTADVTLVRDGTIGGFQIQVPASSGNITIAAMGIDNTGASKNAYINVSAGPATIQLYSNAQNIVHFECTFGVTYSAGQHLTRVTLSRFNGDNFWSGDLVSTYNQ